MMRPDRRFRLARSGLLVLAALTSAVGCGAGESPAAGCPRISGNICTVAGTGIAGDGLDALPALETRLYLPQDMTVGPDGKLYVVDWNNHRIRAIDKKGVMRIVAGAGELGPMSDLLSADRLNHPTNVAFNPLGRSDLMFIAAWHNSEVKTVDMSLGTDIAVACGTGARALGGNGGPALAAKLNLPVAVAFNGVGDMLIADQANQMIRIVDHVTGIIQTLAGVGPCEDSVNPAPCTLADEGPAIEAGFHFPIGQAATPGGRIAIDAVGNIYVADTNHNRVRKIDTSGIIHTIAGTGQNGFAGDGGPATQAQLGELTDVAIGADGAVYIADTTNSCVRVVSPTGIITTFAGQCGVPGDFAGDGGPATAATLDRPYGVEVAPSGDVYVADTHHQRIRVIYH